jgi:pyruvate/2-oxoglutarate dehydrogenase complex dihydrolipoamide dehydrogenase (E3) component
MLVWPTPQVKNVKVDESRKRVIAELESGKRVIGDSLLYAVGRQCNSDTLNLAAAGLTADARGMHAFVFDLSPSA